jgi:hypothetical protein
MSAVNPGVGVSAHRRRRGGGGDVTEARKMSLVLAHSEPSGTEIKTLDAQTVYLGPLEISMSDFACAVIYVLTNTNLEENDPRVELVRAVKRLVEVDGFGHSGKRLAFRSRFDAGKWPMAGSVRD